ncbi:MAG TPA: IS4 family transposase [Ignavibacteria bacterium]
MTNLTLFAQIINKLSRTSFKNLTQKHNSDKHSKGINSCTHLVSMLFCHFAKANSLREISNGLKSATGNLNHLGILNKTPSKSSLSYINQHRNNILFKDYYYCLLSHLQQSAGFKQIKFKIKKKIYLLDSTLISLCLSLYDWAHYTKVKGAIKLHTLLDYDGCLPSYVHITTGKDADVKIAKLMNLQSDTVLVADRGYLDFDLLNKWDRQKVNFVIRLKDNIKHIDLGEYSLPEKKQQHILINEKIKLLDSYEKYPKTLRRIAVYDPLRDKTIELITNNFTWTVETIAELYKQRWQVEIFFKELKQHLKIKTFVGTNENSVMIQIWTALITILIMKYLKQISEYLKN